MPKLSHVLPRKLGVLNTSIATENTGDFIIMDACSREIDDSFPDSLKVHFTSHERMGFTSLRLQRKMAFNIACGTNLLHAHMGLIKQWRVGVMDSFFVKPTVLLGVGWRSRKSRKTDAYTRWLLKRLLSPHYLHSVRDSYTESRLKEIGITNVVNTSCPTMWTLTPAHCAGIPARPAKSVVFTLTDYSRHPETDVPLINTLKQVYGTVYFWGQGTGDYEYVHEIFPDEGIQWIPPGLQSFDDMLSDNTLSLDYVGTRLHGGIRALQRSRRTIIIGVDHRANEKAKDFNLPVVDRYENSQAIEEHIRSTIHVSVAIPDKNIATWKSQFKKTSP